MCGAIIGKGGQRIKDTRCVVLSTVTKNDCLTVDNHLKNNNKNGGGKLLSLLRYRQFKFIGNLTDDQHENLVENSDIISMNRNKTNKTKTEMIYLNLETYVFTSGFPRQVFVCLQCFVVHR